MVTVLRVLHTALLLRVKMSDEYLVLRSFSGLSGDMLVAGLSKIAGYDQKNLNDLVSKLRIPGVKDCVSVEEVLVGGISGWRASVALQKDHCHRTLQDINAIINASLLSVRAKEISKRTFQYLAEAEGAIHGIAPDEVTFHEVGALDSILDICLAAALFDQISPVKFISSPLPICDGRIKCRHGVLPAPAPAVLQLLKGIPVYGVDSEGETVTPTAVALLKSLGAVFEKWPAFTVKETVRIYGTRTLPNIPNGVIFAMGAPCSIEETQEKMAALGLK